MRMNNIQSGHLLASIAIALFAGASGSMLTLWVTSAGVSETERAPSSLIDEGAGTTQVFEEPDAADDLSFVEFDASDNTDPEVRLALNDAAAERSQLADVVAQLTRQVETLESDVINITGRRALDQDDLPESEALPGTDNANGRISRARSQINNMIAAGLDPISAEALQARQNEFQLRRLELIDSAEREGWRDSDQFTEQLSALDEERPDLRDELGDDAYDRYLFEAGRSNRVQVESIIPGSAADFAGLQTGDIILDYAQERVFSTRGLQSATRAGSRGESVTVIVERQGQSVTIEVPRGPLGVSLDAQQQNPS